MATNLSPSANPQFTPEVPALTTNSVAHPDTWNPINQILLDNTVVLKDLQEQTDLEVENLSERVGDIEQTSSVSVQRAVRLDWLYRDNRIAHELWAPGFTLIDTIDTPIIEGVVGDDSVDVQSTAQLRTGEYYVLAQDVPGGIEGETVRVTELVQCTAILSVNRIRLANNLSRGFTGGVLTRCSLKQVGAAYAEGSVGDIWLSKPINIGNDAEGGAVVIRRSLNAAEVRLFFRDNTHANWTERVWSTRRQGGDIPAGYADYEFVLPMRGDGSLRVDIDGEPAVIRHIVALSATTGLGGFVNPAMRPAAPNVIAPADGAIGIFERPTLAIDIYVSPGGTPQAGVQFQLSTSAEFTEILHDSGELPPGLSYTMPGDILTPGVLIHPRARVKDTSGLWSDWSPVGSFTTAASFAYVAAPVIVAPANNATQIGETPIIQSGAFAVVGGEDTHVASRARIRTASGSWSAPLWDSGETASLLSIAVPPDYLQPGENVYYLQFQHKGQVRGWSEWSAEVKITTKQAFANVAGVALLQAGGDGGTWAYIDDDGNTVTAPGTAYFNAHPVFGGMQDVLIDGQTMVKIPKFYIKQAVISGGANNGKPAWWVSDQPVAGYEVHPAFKSGGTEVDQIYVGKYQASMEGSKLASKSGVLPAVSRSLTQFIADANARNVSGVSGFMLWSFYHWSAIQWLYLVENATMNSQAKTGQGRVSASSAANVDASDVAQATYRGIVGLWGNVWQWMDGLKTSGGSIHLWDRNGNKTWVNTTKRRATAAGTTIYPTTFMDHSGTGYDFSDGFIGDTGPTSNSNATAPDYQYFNEDGEDFPVVGGVWSDAALAGLWTLGVSTDAAGASPSIGARLAKV